MSMNLSKVQHTPGLLNLTRFWHSEVLDVGSSHLVSLLQMIFS